MKTKSFVICLLIGICISSFSQNHMKVSLAEWSIHRSIQSGQLTNLDFPRIARSQYGIGAIEYVSVLFENKTAVNDTVYLRKLKLECEKYDVISNLIMVDGEGNLGDSSIIKRKKAVENHFKWVKAAKFLGCHSIRINAAGDGTPEEVRLAVIDGLTKLCDFAAKYEINVIVENHWGNSSNPDWLISVIKGVNRKNCGLLPDFGNFDTVDKYQAVEKMMPYAKGVSAKSYNFDTEGNETKIDYKKMLDIVKKSGYNGYVGIEYEGIAFTEDEGIKKTIKLLEKFI